MREKELDGGAYYKLRPAAEALEEKYPAGADPPLPLHGRRCIEDRQSSTPTRLAIFSRVSGCTSRCRWRRASRSMRPSWHVCSNRTVKHGFWGLVKP